MPFRRAGKGYAVVAAVLGMIVGWGGIASAALITFNFEGNVTSVDPDSIPYFSTSDKLVGSFSFNSTAVNHGSSAQFGNYEISQLSFTLGQKAYVAGPNFGSPQIRIVSNSALFPNTNTPDDYRIFSSNNLGPSAGPQLPRDFAIDISGLGKFPNNSLPLTPPSIGNLLSTDRRFAMSFVQPVGAVGGVIGEITSLTLAPVPLPGAVLLFGTGLIGLAALGKIR